MTSKEKMQEIPSQIHQRTWLALENTTDYVAFQQLCDEVLSAHWGYKIHPRGMSARGTVVGQPDSWGDDGKGKRCVFEYGTSPDWRSKLKDDLAKVASVAGVSAEVFVFCTNRFVSADAERECIAMVEETYGWELRLFGLGDLAIPLDTAWQDIRKRFLGIDVEHHNWVSLLTACKEQRRKVLKRYSGKYQPSFYVQRKIEQAIDSWYRQAIVSIHQEKAKAQLLAIVDQAGAGKTTLVLHLSEVYGTDAPVIVIPGSCTITDDHALEREIVDAVGYPVQDHTYHAKVHELCQVAQQESRPLLVIIDGINENSDPRRVRNALEQVLNACRDYPLLLLISCRDAVWPLTQSTLLGEFLPQEHSQFTGDGVLSLGMYDDDEFEQACQKYFAYHHVDVNLSVEAAQRLHSPLLLRIFAEVNHHCSFKLVTAAVDQELWNKYLETKIETIYEAMERHIRKEAIRRVIERITQLMLEHNQPSLSLDDLAEIDHLDPDDTSPASLFLQFKNAAILFEDSFGTVSFVYETFLEFIIGKTLAREFEEPTKRQRVLEQVDRLARTYRWRQVPLYIAELVSLPDVIVECLRSSHIWLAAQSLRRATSAVSPQIRQQVIVDLEEKLKSEFALDRRRAADFLGLLGATESKEKLYECWSVSQSDEALRALALLDVEKIVEPFLCHLGRFLEWHLPHNQELVDALPESFRQQLAGKAIVLLKDAEHMFAAAHTLGYLKSVEAVAPLLTHLEATDWSDEVALLSLLRIGTPEAFDALRTALGEIGQRLSLCEQQSGKVDSSNRNQKETEQEHNTLYIALSHVRVRGFQHCPLHVIVPFLTQLLDHPSLYVRSEAIQSLGYLGAYETALALAKSAAHEEGRTGRVINEALRAFGERIEEEPFLALIHDPATPDPVLRAAIEALGASRDERVLEPLSVYVTQHRFLFEVIQALGNTRLPQAVPVLVQVLADQTIDFNTQRFLNREMTDPMVIESLGRLQHPSAFEPIEQFFRKNLPKVGYQTISALAASGGERALPVLHEIWNLDPEKRRTILRSLLWIGTSAAMEKIVELLNPLDAEKATLLAMALSGGSGLDFITGHTFRAHILGATDDRLVAIVDTYFDEMDFEGMQHALMAMKYIATARAQQLLERVASDSQYTISPSNITPNPVQTIHNMAVHKLWELGSSKVIDTVLDALTEYPVNVVEFRLTRMRPELVREALQSRLASADKVILIRLLTLLGTFGDSSVLPDVRFYIDDSRQEVSNAAYETEQRILGLAYF